MGLQYSQLVDNDSISLSSNVDQRVGQKAMTSNSELIGNKLNKITVRIQNSFSNLSYDVTAYLWDASGNVKSQSANISMANISTQTSDVSFNFISPSNVQVGDIVGIGVNGGLADVSSLSVRLSTSNSDPNTKLLTWRNGKWFNAFFGEGDLYLKAYYGLSEEVQAILDKFDNNDFTYPSWFNSNINSVKDGSITGQQFLNSFNSLLQGKTIVDTTIIIEPTPVVIPDGFHQMPDGSIMADSEMYNFIIESDGLVRMFRIGSVQYTEIKIQPDSVQSIIDRNIGRLLTAEERSIPYPRPEPEPEPTFCVNVYSIRDSGSVYSTSYPEITAAKVEELQQTQYVVFCNAATVPTEKQVQDFYGFTPVPPQVDTTINSTMISQSVGAFVLKDGRITGEVLYIANQSFNPFYYDKQITSLVQIKSKSGVVIAMKSNNLNFTQFERDERITIDESAGNFKELLIDFFVWDSPTSQIIFSETKQIQVVDETKLSTTTCQAGYHKDFSGKCVADDPVGEIPKDRLIETLKGFLFGTVALSLLARKY